jgi:hypothetical protein
MGERAEDASRSRGNALAFVASSARRSPSRWKFHAELSWLFEQLENLPQPSEEDLAHRWKVNGHLAQRPAKADAALEHTRWTASLRNWGHDPLAP